VTPERIRFIAQARWRSTNFVSPHQYTLREWNDSGEFSQFVQRIREHPESWDRRFLGATLRSLRIGEFYYWTMGAPVEETTVINRAKPEWLFRTDVFPELPSAEERRPRGTRPPTREEMEASE
jgi:hypothetical protein